LERKGVGGYILEKEELAIQTLKYLLRNDKAALLRVMSSIKRAIWEEESKCLAEKVIQRARK